MKKKCVHSSLFVYHAKFHYMMTTLSSFPNLKFKCGKVERGKRKKVKKDWNLEMEGRRAMASLGGFVKRDL